MEPVTYKPNKTTEFFHKINLIVYVFGFPNFWIEEFKFSKRFIKIYNRFNVFNNTLISIWILFELSGYFTQHHLSENQRFNFWVYSISHPILYGYRIIMTSHKKRVRQLLYSLTVTLKEVHNDPEVEKRLIHSTMIYLAALLFSCILSMVMYTSDACMDMVRANSTFTMIITAYPDVEDRSNLANVVRAITYIIWWIFITRVFALYILVIPLATCLSHQYKNLQSYFYSLNDIFDREDLSQIEKEQQYEKQFKVGIKFHSDTLRCTRETQTVCSGVFSGQIIFNILLIVVLMAQMVKSERNLVNLCATVFTASSVLISTGFFMWNAGDVTVEASHLSTAMYFSGWHNCRGASSVRVRNLVVITINNAQRPVVLKGLGYIGLSYQSYLRASHLSNAIYFSGWHNCRGASSTRIRNLVTITMSNAQRPVVLKGLGYIALSYQSYLTIVKSSYSVFSVLF